MGEMPQTRCSDHLVIFNKAACDEPVYFKHCGRLLGGGVMHGSKRNIRPVKRIGPQVVEHPNRRTPSRRGPAARALAAG